MTDGGFDTIRLDIADGVATITLDRPDRRNVYDVTMRRDLLAAFDRTDADDAVRAVIVTGAGASFCAGADLAKGATAFDPGARGDPDENRVTVNGITRDGAGLVTLRIFRSLKPVIGAINGDAAGAGATIACAFDLRLAADTARFGFVFARRGLTPEAASSWFLPRLVGIQTALEWCYTGRLVSASEAQARGLVRSVHPGGELMPTATAIAREIAEQAAPVSVALIRRMMWQGLGQSHPMEAHRADTRAIRARAASADLREGLAAYAEKRPPAFPDVVTAGLPDLFPEWSEPSFR